MVSCVFNYYPRIAEVLWLDLETNSDNCLTNSILELHAQYANWYDPYAPPLASFYALVIPEKSINLFSSIDAASTCPSFEQFVESLELSDWCKSTFTSNKLISDLYSRACAEHARDTLRASMSIEAVVERFSIFLDALSLAGGKRFVRDQAPVQQHVLAGRNVHYDMSVLRKIAPDLFTRFAKHVYDTGPLSFLSNVLNGVIPTYSSSTSGDHRAVYDVVNTRLTNKDLVDAIVLDTKTLRLKNEYENRINIQQIKNH